MQSVIDLQKYLKYRLTFDQIQTANVYLNNIMIEHEQEMLKLINEQTKHIKKLIKDF